MGKNYNSFLKFTNFFTFLFIIFASYWNTSIFVVEMDLTHNVMESLLLGSTPLHGLGVPYKDYWGIYPPGIYLFMSLFDIFFSGNLMVFKMLHPLLLIGTLLLFWNILFKVVGQKYHIYLNLFVVIATLFYTSSAISNTLFSSVLLGNLLGLIGLWLLLFNQKEYVKYGLGVVILTWAGMLKDPFQLLMLLPFIVAVVDYFYRKISVFRLIKNFSIAAFGSFFVLGVHLLYLINLGVINSYLEVMEFKRGSFLKFPPYPNSFEGSIVFFHYFFRETFYFGELFISITFIILFVLAYKTNPNLKNKLDKSFWIILIYCLLNFISFKIQNRVGGTYSLQIILPLFLLLSYFVVKILRTLNNNLILIKGEANKFKLVLICICLTLLLLPSKQIIKTYLQSKPLGPKTFIKNVSLSTIDYGLLNDERVQEIIKKDNRVLNLYGWGNPNFYYHMKVRPFNRFFVVHPQIMGEKQNREWVKSFANELPKVVRYRTGVGADMNVEEFEAKTIHLKKMLDDCYTKISEEIYILPEGECGKFTKSPIDYVSDSYLQFF